MAVEPMARFEKCAFRADAEALQSVAFYTTALPPSIADTFVGSAIPVSIQQLIEMVLFYRIVISVAVRRWP